MACIWNKTPSKQTDILVKWVPRVSSYLNKILILVYMCLHLAITISFITKGLRRVVVAEKNKIYILRYGWCEKSYYFAKKNFIVVVVAFTLAYNETMEKIDLHCAMWPLMCIREFSPKNLHFFNVFSHHIGEISQILKRQKKLNFNLIFLWELNFLF